MTSSADHAATVREDTALLADWAEEPTAISSVDVDNCRARIVAAVEALVALADRATEPSFTLDEMQQVREEGRRLADRATELERERDEALARLDEKISVHRADEWLSHRFHQVCDERDDERERSDRLVTALREVERLAPGTYAAAIARAALGETALQGENLAARVQEARRLLETGDQNALIAYLLERDPAEIAALGETAR